MFRFRENGALFLSKQQVSPLYHDLDLPRIPLFLFCFSVSVESCSAGSHRSSSLVLPLLSGTGLSVYLFTSNTESCDEDVVEAGVGVVEELVDRPGTTNATQLDILQSIMLPFLMRCGF